jgi:hypothetical protein
VKWTVGGIAHTGIVESHSLVPADPVASVVASVVVSVVASVAFVGLVASIAVASVAAASVVDPYIAADMCLADFAATVLCLFAPVPGHCYIQVHLPMLLGSNVSCFSILLPRT